MKKINILNWFYIITLTALVIITTIKIYNFHGSSRYYYSSSVTAPYAYPVYVQDIYFILEGDEQGQINHEQVNGHAYHWGDADVDGSTTQERLPKALVLKYASYRENAFYNDTIALPSKVIAAVFERAGQRNIYKTLSAESGRDVQGLMFLIGIANKGQIVVWLQGNKFEQKLLTYKLHSWQPKEEMDYDHQFYFADTYMKAFDENLPDSCKKLIASGLDKNANYADSSTRYLQFGN
ncbi:DUF2931 family protein [Mucilaginibacter sp. L196]|uniref:DUF2931 family protein n=1 Tax=Mucilaginibacter sp. L196 TaxID=1641870 RepID=UPI00131B0B9B|nr:DUF2931 family protein [Mucilaginibacter sp. L196]